MISGIDFGLILSVAYVLGWTRFVAWAFWPLLIFMVHPRTQGTVTKVSIQEVCTSSGQPISYRPQVTYSYVVGGRVYSSDRYFVPAKDYGDRIGAERDLSGLKDGTPVTVSYNPRNPRDAVVKARMLLEGADLWIYLFCWLPLAFFAVFFLPAFMAGADTSARIFWVLCRSLLVIAPFLTIAICAPVFASSCVRRSVDSARWLALVFCAMIWLLLQGAAGLAARTSRQVYRVLTSVVAPSLAVAIYACAIVRSTVGHVVYLLRLLTLGFFNVILLLFKEAESVSSKILRLSCRCLAVLVAPFVALAFHISALACSSVKQIINFLRCLALAFCGVTTLLFKEESGVFVKIFRLVCRGLVALTPLLNVAIYALDFVRSSVKRMVYLLCWLILVFCAVFFMSAADVSSDARIFWVAGLMLPGLAPFLALGVHAIVSDSHRWKRNI